MSMGGGTSAQSGSPLNASNLAPLLGLLSGGNTPMGTNSPTGNLSPGMLAALQAGGHSQSGMAGIEGSLLGKGAGWATGAALGSVVPGIGTVVGGLVGALAPSLFKKNASPIQDISRAMSLGRPISDASWAQAGYGPGGAQLGAPGAGGLQSGLPMAGGPMPGQFQAPGQFNAPPPFTPMGPLNVGQLPQNFQGGMMRNPQFMQLAASKFPGLLGAQS